MQQQQQHLQTSSPQHKWEDYKIQDIIGGKTPEGVRFLKLFLIDYTSLFSEVVNPSCSKCLNNCLQKYKSKKFEMESTCKYRLKEKYNGLSLKFGSQILVNNRNITDEYANELLKRFEAKVIFDKFPIVEQKNTEVTTETVKPKAKRTSKKAK